jgi:hypothetical protein
MRNEANPRRRSLRLAGYDYSQAGAYFITICTHDRMALFGEIIENDVRLNPNGIIVTATWEIASAVTLRIIPRVGRMILTISGRRRVRNPPLHHP